MNGILEVMAHGTSEATVVGMVRHCRHILKAKPTEFVSTWILNVRKRKGGIKDDVCLAEASG